MTQPINPYAPTSTAVLGERRKAWTDSAAPPVFFQATIDHECWQGIRRLPPSPLHQLFSSAGVSLSGMAIGVVTWNWEPISRWATPLLLIGWTLFIAGWTLFIAGWIASLITPQCPRIQ